ncbi:sensor histidine kinase [Pedobacter sp. AW31-3R]|uniref:sensor histidine kinase n=1 Tax=Pedobacter sp. AW31-3R TaxID=3445781 RepID=UPI003F9FBCAB
MQLKVPTAIKKIVHLITGDTKHMKLEHRIFNFISIIGILIIGYNVPFSYYLGLKSTALLYFVMFFGLCLAYYYARMRKRYKRAIFLCSILVLATLTGTFFITSGVNGPGLLALTIGFFLIIIISSEKHYWIWTSLSVLTGTGLIAVHYFYPALISSPYDNRASLFMDLASSYAIEILVIFAGLFYLKAAYYQEKLSAEVRARELEKMNDEKTKFFSIISHDLRAPLASIQSYMETLKVFEMESEERKMLEHKLSNAVSGTQEMLNNLLSWSKSQLSSSKVNLLPYPIDEVLVRLLHNQKVAATEKNIALNFDIDSSIVLLCDINMLQLVIRNLTGNAIKFTPEYGKIEIRTLRLEEKCLISVKDTGKGIDPANSAAVFSLKAESTYGTANEKGIGLGLYLCKEYTKLQHGEIWFESNRDSGSVFYVSLPLSS